MCILLCLLFASKAIYLVVLGTGYLRSEQMQYRTPVGISHVASEFVVHFVTEFVPCAMLLFFMRKSNDGTPDQALRSDRASSMSSVGASTLPRETANEYLPVVGTRMAPSGGGMRSFGSYNSGVGAAVSRQQQQQPEESMAMLNPYHHQQVRARHVMSVEVFTLSRASLSVTLLVAANPPRLRLGEHEQPRCRALECARRQVPAV